MTSPVVTFDYQAWLARYPEFKAVSEVMAQQYFSEAGLYCANNACNPAFAGGTLPVLLNMLTAHIAWLNAPRDASGAPSSNGTVPGPAVLGRVNSASEGSVSVGIDNGDATAASPSQAWYMTTPYGQAYWAATAPYRTMRYSPLPTTVGGPVFPGGPFFRGLN